MDLNVLTQKINSYTTVASSWMKNVGKIYFDSKPALVKVKLLDDNGKVKEVTIPNIAKVKADFDAKKRFTHSMGIGVDPSGNLNNGKGLALGDNDTGFRQNGDGQLEMFANNQRIAKIYLSGLYVWKEQYYEHWIRNNGTGASGLYWQNSKNPGYGWHIYPQNKSDMTMRTGAGNGGIKGTVENSTARGYIYWTTNNEIGFLNKDRSWSLRTDANKNTNIYGNLVVNKDLSTHKITADSIRFNAGGAANDDAAIQFLNSGSNKGFLRISTSDDNGTEHIEFGDYDHQHQAGSFRQWMRMDRNSTLIRNNLIIDNAGNNVNIVEIHQNEISLWAKHNDANNRKQLHINMFDDASAAEIRLLDKSNNIKSRIILRDDGRLLANGYDIGRGTNWSNASLKNGWVNYGNSFQSVRYKRMPDGTVHIEGLIKSGDNGKVIFTLPVGFRPNARLIFSNKMNDDEKPSRFDVNSDGNVIAKNASSSWTSITCSFVASK